MASDSVQINLAYKRLSKRQYTSTRKKWHEEFPGKPITIKFKDVWLSDIPATPPVASTSIVQVITNLILTEDVTVDGSLCWLTCSTPGNLSTRIGDFIQPDKDLGQGYNIKLYDNVGTQIYVGDPSAWEFDFANGILTFETQPVGFTAPFKISAYRYVGDTGSASTFSTTLDKAYAGESGSGSGKIIHANFGPVQIQASNGSAALQLDPITYTPVTGLADGQIINRGGILYIYDNTRSKWISMNRQNLTFGAKRADGVYLSLGDFSSSTTGWPALRNGVILGITAQSSSGYTSKGFKIIIAGVTVLNFNLNSGYYVNAGLNLSFTAGDLVKILASSEFGPANNTIINLEIGWVV